MVGFDQHHRQEGRERDQARQSDLLGGQPTPGTPRRNRHRARLLKRLDLAQLLLEQRPEVFRDAGGPRAAPQLALGILGTGFFQQQPVFAGFADLDHQQVLAHRMAGDGPPGDAAHRGRIDRDGGHG